MDVLYLSIPEEIDAWVDTLRFTGFRTLSGPAICTMKIEWKDEAMLALNCSLHHTASKVISTTVIKYSDAIEPTAYFIQSWRRSDQLYNPLWDISCLKPREVLLIEDANDELLNALYKAKLRGNYPGPCEARCIMRDLQKARCEVYAKRMHVCIICMSINMFVNNKSYIFNTLFCPIDTCE